MTLLTASKLSKTFGKQRAVDQVSFSLAKEKCTALLGPNGSGKTTILKMLSGLLKPSNGDIRFVGVPLKGDTRQYIGYLPQQPVFYDWRVVLNSFITNIFEQWMVWSPARLSDFVGEMVLNGSLNPQFPFVFSLLMILMIALLVFARIILQKKELAD